ncbi:MarR family transcriptional regulator [Clostridium estertheticum]|uniref:MarR family transcriptional regulator n=1 Tax=Clostridium estertheticum TaxID=238834 RepID=UPI000B01C150|nr:MarR family transcriptional regulator [Clostridium estertheticum]MBZ9616754.1 MarR family transcriptional regulator [Clostridium estertheticum subsp. laramiense]WAG72462.1 MarR family transcriptional regulator [Clostridium estertheticum]
MLNNTQGGFFISQIKQISGRIFEKILVRNKIDDFNGPQGRILYILWQEDSIPIKELSKKTGLALTTLTSMLDRMESAELVNRTFTKTDRRKVLIVLTEKAKKLKNKYDEVSSQMNEIYYDGFSDDEILQLENYLSRILKNLKQKQEE